MRNFVFAFLFCYLGLSSFSSQAASEALEDGVDPMAGHAFVASPAAAAISEDFPSVPFNPDDCWSDMLNLAQGRAEWFRETLNFLKDETVGHQERAEAVKKIRPEYDQIPLKKGLRPHKQMQVKNLKIINTMVDDLESSALYWNFLVRTLEFYNIAPHNSPEIRRDLLSHLIGELINFDKFAVGDLVSNDSCKYFSEEYFINKAIYDEGKELADHYRVKIGALKTPNPKRKQAFPMRTPDDLQKLKGTQKTDPASNKSSYFLEQVIYFRDHTLKAQPNQPLHPQLRAFQQYILPVSGPVFIEEAQNTRVSPAVATQEPGHKGKLKKKKKKKKESSQPPLSASAENSNQLEEEGKAEQPANLQKGAQDIQAFPPSSPAAAGPKPLEDGEEGKQPQEEGKSRKPPIKSLMPIPLSVSPEFLGPIKRLSQVKFCIEHRTSGAYLYREGTHPFSVPVDPAYFNLRFLQEIQSHYFPRKNRLPNIAQGAITFHYESGNQEITKTVQLPGIFLYIPRGDKSVPIKIAVEKHLRRQVIEGIWKGTATDSEPVLLLTLLKKLPGILQQEIIAGHGPITLKYVVLSISSYRDCCSNCQRLIQGFQWRLRDIITGFNIPGLSIGEGFNTLAIVRGHTLHVDPRGGIVRAPPVPEKGAVYLETSFHKLVCVPEHLNENY